MENAKAGDPFNRVFNKLGLEAFQEAIIRSIRG
jgi:hypothetical protein